jgi:hypothetical protein
LVAHLLDAFVEINLVPSCLHQISNIVRSWHSKDLLISQDGRLLNILIASSLLLDFLYMWIEENDPRIQNACVDLCNITT